MGNSCGSKSKVADSGETEERSSFVYVKPEAICDIMGVEVEREQAIYQYALFCITRLVDKYRVHMFPEVTMNVGSFREDIRDYMAVVNEIRHDLCFEERELPSRNNVDALSDERCKSCLSVLSYQYYYQVKDKEQEKQTRDCLAYDALQKEFKTHEPILMERVEFQNCYEDTLKMFIRDLERKEIWQLSTVYSNKDFQSLLKQVEPETWNELADDSFEINVPTKHPHDT